MAQPALPPKSDSAQNFLISLTRFADSLKTVFGDTPLMHGEKVLSPAYYDRYFSQWLAYVNFAKDGYPDGNSVLLAPNSANTQLRATLAHKANNLVFNAGTQVSFSNNIGDVLTKSNVTSNTTFFGSCSILPNISRKIYYDPNEAIENDQNILTLLNQFVAAQRKKYISDYAADSLKYAQLSDSVQSMGDTVPPVVLADYYTSVQKLKAYDFNHKGPWYVTGFLDAKISSVKDSLSKAIDSIELANDAIQNFKFGWFNGSFAYTRNDYTTYNGNAAFTKRIKDFYFDSLAFNVSYNFLFERTQKYQQFASSGDYFLDRLWLRSFYFTINYNLSRDLNYAHISPVSLVTSQNIVGASDTVYQLQSTAKGINITNKPAVTALQHSFGAKAVTVLTNSSVMGLDLSFNATYGKLIEPVYTAQAGILLRFTDSQSQTSKVNFEIFLQLPDIGDSGHTGLSTWQRKVIGINTSIPFSKLFF